MERVRNELELVTIYRLLAVTYLRLHDTEGKLRALRIARKHLTSARAMRLGH